MQEPPAAGARTLPGCRAARRAPENVSRRRGDARTQIDCSAGHPRSCLTSRGPRRRRFTRDSFLPHVVTVRDSQAVRGAGCRLRRNAIMAGPGSKAMAGSLQRWLLPQPGVSGSRHRLRAGAARKGPRAMRWIRARPAASSRVRRRAVAAATAAMVIVAGCGSAPGSPSRSAPRQPGRPGTPVPSVDVAAFAGHGELAFVSRGTL